MLTDRLKQRRGIESRELRIKEFALELRADYILFSESRSIQFEDVILDGVFRSSKLEPVSACIAGFFFMLNFLIFNSVHKQGIPPGLVFTLTATVVAMIMCWALSGAKVKIPVSGQAPLVIFRTRPSEREVETFLEQLGVHIKKFMLEKYGPVPGVMDRSEQLRRINWLRERNLLTTMEYNNLVEPLRIPEDRIVGFGPLNS